MSIPSLLSIPQLLLTTCVGFVVLFCGVLAIVASARGSQRYRSLLAALGTAVLMSFLFVWLQYEIGLAGHNLVRSQSGAIDPVLEASAFATYHIYRLLFVAIGIVGVFLAMISLLLRKGAKPIEE